jgi:hypothetical protein
MAYVQNDAKTVVLEKVRVLQGFRICWESDSIGLREAAQITE